MTPPLSRDDVLAGLRRHGFHLADESPRYHAQTWARDDVVVNVKATETNSLVVHPALEPSLAILEAVPGVIRGERPYCHNSQYAGFPKRVNAGKTAIHYGIDFGFESTAAFDALIGLVLQQAGVAGHARSPEFDVEARMFYEGFIDEGNPQFLYWLPRYKKTLQVVRDALSRGAPDEIFEIIWKTRDNSVSNAGQGVMGFDLAVRIRERLVQVIADVARDGSPQQYDDITARFEQWRAQGVIQSVPRLMIARVFSAIHPGLYHTTVDSAKQEYMIPWFERHTGFVAPSGNWALRASALCRHLDGFGVFSEEVELRNMFPWYVREQMRDGKGQLAFRPGHAEKSSAGIAEGKGGTRTIDYRQNLIQSRLYAHLVTLHGKDAVATEHATGTGGRADALVKRPDGRYDLYEIKPASTAASAVRQAIGQLLEYAYRENGLEPARLIVVSDAVVDTATAAYLDRLRAVFALDIEYMHMAAKAGAENEFPEDA